MEIIIFLLLAGLWAAFLVPPFLSSRRDAPISSTRRFDRSLARLASVQERAADGVPLNRDRILVRRRRVFVALISLAIITLGLALWQRSLNLLFLHLVIDALAVAYVAMLLNIKQRRTAEPDIDLEQPADEEEDRQARVLASG